MGMEPTGVVVTKTLLENGHNFMDRFVCRWDAQFDEDGNEVFFECRFNTINEKLDWAWRSPHWQQYGGHNPDMEPTSMYYMRSPSSDRQVVFQLREKGSGGEWSKSYTVEEPADLE